MQTKTTFNFLGAILTSLILAACGGGSGSSLQNTVNGATSSIVSSSASNNSSAGAQNWRIGNGSGNSFIAGAIGSDTSTTLFAGDKIQLSVSVADDQGILTKDIKDVTFDSPCLTAGASTLTGGNTVKTISGTATVQYQVGNECDLDDKVTATIANGSDIVEASITLPINTRRIGSGSGDSFTPNTLEIGIGNVTLSAGGSTSVTAYIVNTAGDLVTDPMDVTFTSPCISAGNAQITDGNVVTTSNGKAMANYEAKGCSGIDGIDTIKATTTFRGQVLIASGNISVKPDSPQTIAFIDATPTLVSIKGTGGLETSILRFQVRGQTGSPIKGVCVNFAPSTIVGKLTLVPSNCNPVGPETFGSSTDAQGYVSTIVQAGTVATTVRVTATTANGISTQSNILAVSTGIPDQKGTSLSLSDLEPISWTHDGVESKATIRLADAFFNPAPDGTAVSFTTSGGAIDPNCVTTNGACTVTWRSQSPRPTSSNLVSFATTAPFGMICPTANDLDSYPVNECRSGRITILATAIGNESFIDGNGNGLYDDPSVDIFITHKSTDVLADGVTPDPNRFNCNAATPLPTSSTGTNKTPANGTPKGCDDLPEAYVDGNFNGFRSADESFSDFNDNQIYEGNNGKYDGALCSGIAKATGACTTNKVNVRSSATLVMSCETPFFQSGLLPGQHDTETFTAVDAGSLRGVPMLLADCNGNGMPAGTTVKVITTNLINATATISPSTALTMSTEPSIITLFITPDKDSSKKPAGAVIIEITGAGITTSTSVNLKSQ